MSAVVAPLAFLVAAVAAPEAKLVATAAELGTAFDRFETADGLGRTISFYVSAGRDKDAARPLALFVQGSGATSVFQKSPDGRVGAGLPGLLLREGKGAIHVAVVEKPGVEFLATLDRPGTAAGASAEFNREHTLPRWAEAVGAALRASAALPGVDASRVLVAGHSEGGIVAARVAAAHSALVTHAGVLSGGGPSQLFEMAESARRPRSPDEPKDEREKRVESVYATWAEIMADPDSATKMVWGHSYRRWSSYLAESPLDHLLAAKTARIFVAYGTEDESSPTVSNDVLRAELVRRGRDVVVQRRIGEDHGFRKPSDPPGPGSLPDVFRALVEWFRE